jgi:hypothetical protein
MRYGAVPGFSFSAMVALYYCWLFKDKSHSKNIMNVPSSKSKKGGLLNSFDFKKVNKLIGEFERPKSSSTLLITNSILFLIIALSITGIWSNILIPNEMYIDLFWWSIVVSLILFVIWLYVSIFLDCYAKRNADKFFKKSNRQKYTLIFGMGIGIPILVAPAITRGVPSIPHLFLGQHTEHTVTVSAKRGGYYGKTCSGGVELKEYSYLFNNKICGLKKSDWQSINVGGKLILIGNYSSYGFTTDRYRLVRK